MSKAAAHGCGHIYKSLSICFLLTVPLVRLVLAARVKAADDGASAVHRIVIFSAPTRREYERELKEARERAAFIVMELARGRSLAEWRERHGDLGFVRPILRQVADALTAVDRADPQRWQDSGRGRGDRHHRVSRRCRLLGLTGTSERVMAAGSIGP